MKVIRRTNFTCTASKFRRKVDVSVSLQNDKRMPQGRLAVVSYIIVGMIGLKLVS